MGIFDIILLLILAGFVFYGLFFGLIKTLGSLVGVVVGAWAASHFYLQIFEWAKDLSFGYDNLGKIIAFIIIFTVVNRLTNLIFSILDKAFDFLTIIPFLKTINRLAGAVLGLVEGALVLGLILYMAVRYTPLGTWFGHILVDSQIAPRLLSFTEILTPFFPEILEKLQSLI